jgi:hypothetical protein
MFTSHRQEEIMRIWTLGMMGALVCMAGCSANGSPTAPQMEQGQVAGKRIVDSEGDGASSARAAKVTAYRVVQNERDFSLRFRVPRSTAVEELLVGSDLPRHTFAYKQATYRTLGWGIAAKGPATSQWQEVELRIPRKWEGVWKEETAPLLRGLYLIVSDNKQL